jgi:protein SCO1/2
MRVLHGRYKGRSRRLGLESKRSRGAASAKLNRRGLAMAFSAVLLSLTASIPGMGAEPSAKAGRIDQRAAFEFSQSAIGRSVGDYVLTAAGGESVSLAEYRGKPLVISLVYTSCGSICPVATQNLARAVSAARRAIGGGRFEILTVGFDARNDTPARTELFAKSQDVDWRVASASGETIQALLKDLGFTYAEIAGGFDHIAQTTILDGEGRVFQQVYGENFPIQMFMEPLKDAVYRTGTAWSFRGVVDRIKFICTTFDPGVGRYRIDYGLIFGGFLGALSLVLMGGMILREWRRASRAQGV